MKSNIAYNEITKQFGMIIYINQGLAKIMDCGAWDAGDYSILTIDEAKRLLKFDDPHSSWNQPSEECLKAVFLNEEKLPNYYFGGTVILNFKPEDFQDEDLGMSGQVLKSPYRKLKDAWERKQKFFVWGEWGGDERDLVLIEEELIKKLHLVPKQYLTKVDE